MNERLRQFIQHQHLHFTHTLQPKIIGEECLASSFQRSGDVQCIWSLQLILDTQDRRTTGDVSIDVHRHNTFGMGQQGDMRRSQRHIMITKWFCQQLCQDNCRRVNSQPLFIQITEYCAHPRQVSRRTFCEIDERGCIDIQPLHASESCGSGHYHLFHSSRSRRMNCCGSSSSARCDAIPSNSKMLRGWPMDAGAANQSITRLTSSSCSSRESVRTASSTVSTLMSPTPSIHVLIIATSVTQPSPVSGEAWS